MLGKGIESSISIEQSTKQKRKIKLIIISKRGNSNKKKGKEDKERKDSKITFQNQKGRFEIRMENFTQTINKNKIDKTVKSLMKNISLLNIDNKNNEQINKTLNIQNKIKNEELIDNEVNNFCDIYLEKEKNKNDENIIIYPNKKDINDDDDVLFKKIKMIEKEKETNEIKLDNDNKKETNRDLLKKQNSEEQIIYDNSSEKKDIKNLLGLKNNNLNINNYIDNDNNKKEDIFKNEEQKKVIHDIKEKDILNIIEKNNINNMSRNLGRQLISNRNSEILNQSTNNLNKVEQNISSNSNFKINNINDSNINIQIKRGTGKFKCYICGISYSTSLSYVANCYIHTLCKKCAKAFYEEKIESGVKELFCPFIFCGKKFSKEQAKKFLSKTHLNLLEERSEKNENLNSIKFLNDDVNDKNIKRYSMNHVIDINNNKLFYNFNKSKNIYCSKCNKDSLFCRDKQVFMRCLNCNYAQCKYCYKEYTKDHFDMNSNNYCKVYYRSDDISRNKLNKVFVFLLELLLVISIFFITIIVPFVLPKRILMNSLLKENKNKKCNCIFYYIKVLLIYLFSFCIFIVFLPITIILFPYFPSFLSIFDFP